ncbi:SCP2 sterol-binding domain-containing protein [Bacillus sp. BRMEA1]|uniref:SCP2 sterol-binding domain-containing protein n=1 Tax=Neobacillus endophyticus TaxID=2738405 RepID=UPI0015649B2D|nr:SCP2 sterol-binding domain-containing protein [Neobacillus endophyticus]NRD76423.1 SCP2 sterol-binding domain-containing protein [Neobacillus endophyticus]
MSGVVEMIEAINTFLQQVKVREHIVPLIQQADLRVSLHCHAAPVQLVIKNGEILMLHDSEQQIKPNNVIWGSAHAFELLLEGKTRLRELERNGDLKIEASLRMILLLESIFYLTKARQDFAKII